MEYLSDNAYLAVKPEAVAGTPVTPTNFVPLLSESVRSIMNYTADRRFKGLSWKANDILRGNRTHEGELSILADADNLGHILNMFMALGVTTGDATDGYTHPFTVGDCDTYSLEIKRGIYAQRLYGVKVDSLSLDFADGTLQVRADIQARGQFSVAKLGVALTGAGMTNIVLDDTYDLAPTKGLVAGDVIVIGTDELTLLTVDADGVTVTFTSTSLTYSADEPIYLKPQTASLSGLQDPLYQGNTLVGLGVDETASTTAAGSKATATPVHEFSLDLKNNLFTTPRTGSVDPVNLLPRTKEGQVKLKQLLENENDTADFLDRTKQAMTIMISGQHINPDFSTKELVTIKLYNIKMTEHDNALTVGEYIVDDKTYEVLYDDSDAKAMTIDLVNRTAGASY